MESGGHGAAATPVFVVCTGRCGSTALSNVLRLHPDVLSLSELFAFVDVRFRPEPVSGADLWDVVSRPDPRLAWVVRIRLRMPEVLYRPSDSTRFTPETGIPPILVTTLPHLSDDPEGLFDEIGRWALEQPPRPFAEHFRALFGWLCGRFGRRVWVERSGLSLPRTPILAAGFPDARFVHLYRDGRDVAMSMSRHDGFRMMWASGNLERALHPPQKTLRELLAEGGGDQTTETANTLDSEQFAAIRPPVAEMGRFWSDLVVQGREHLDQLAPERVSELRYEDLVAEPETQLRRLAALIGVTAHEDWLGRAAALLRPRPHAWAELPPDELRQLEEAVAPGMRLLYGTAPLS